MNTQALVDISDRSEKQALEKWISEPLEVGYTWTVSVLAIEW